MFLFILFMCFYFCVNFTLTIYALLTFLTFITFSNHLSLQFKNGDEMLQIIPLGKPLHGTFFVTTSSLHT